MNLFADDCSIVHDVLCTPLSCLKDFKGLKDEDTVVHTVSDDSRLYLVLSDDNNSLHTYNYDA